MGRYRTNDPASKASTSSTRLVRHIGLLCSTTDGRWPEPHLTPRECEIVRLVARDRSNKEIAKVLAISQHTVASHLRNVFHKFGVRSKAAMVASVLELLAERSKSAAAADRRRAKHDHGRRPDGRPP